jgi:hypothetical protein
MTPWIAHLLTTDVERLTWDSVGQQIVAYLES